MFNFQVSQTTKLVAITIVGALALIILISNRSPADLEPRQELLKMEPESGPYVPGGLGAPREADDTVKEVVEGIKEQLEQKTGSKFDTIEVLSYKTQIVAGTNYFIKAKVTSAGQEKIAHLRIYKDLQKKLELTSYQLDKKVEDRIEYFQ